MSFTTLILDRWLKLLLLVLSTIGLSSSCTITVYNWYIHSFCLDYRDQSLELCSVYCLTVSWELCSVYSRRGGVYFTQFLVDMGRCVQHAIKNWTQSDLRFCKNEGSKRSQRSMKMGVNWIENQWENCYKMPKLLNNTFWWKIRSI